MTCFCFQNTMKIITEVNLEWKAWFSMMCLQWSSQKQWFDRKLLLSPFTGGGECLIYRRFMTWSKLPKHKPTKAAAWFSTVLLNSVCGSDLRSFCLVLCLICVDLYSEASFRGSPCLLACVQDRGDLHGFSGRWLSQSFWSWVQHLIQHCVKIIKSTNPCKLSLIRSLSCDVTDDLSLACTSQMTGLSC